jgi:hypothetical protein
VDTEPAPVAAPPDSDPQEETGSTLVDERPGRSHPRCTGVRRTRESWRD